MVKILGIETSCDETAAAVVDDARNILSNVIHTQTQHSLYGGVVPEIASRAHIEKIEETVRAALQNANTKLEDIDAIAVTAGPGLIGGVIVGLMFAKGLSAGAGKPLICVNHLEGHALTCRLTDEVEFPYLLLLVSGGHCQFIICESLNKYKIIGQTMGQLGNRMSRRRSNNEQIGLFTQGHMAYMGRFIPQISKHRASSDGLEG